MRNLISGGSMTRVTEAMPPSLFKQYGGILAKPTRGNHPMRAVELGASWAADNDCFVRYDPVAILRMLDRFRDIPNCLFVNAPDVVRNHKSTLTMFWYWQPIISAYGYPVAFTLQNGVSLDAVPFDYCDALFIGGDTDFKFSLLVRSIVAEAKRRGKWVHNGRVNSIQRIIYSRVIGCDSFDGTGYAKWARHIKNHLPYHSKPITYTIPMEI